MQIGANMSLKEKIEFIKSELTLQEKFLESFLKLESFFRKWKYAVLLVVIFAIAFAINSYMGDVQKEKDNEVFYSLMTDFDEKSELKQNNIKLYSIAKYANKKIENKNELDTVPYLQQVYVLEDIIAKNNIDDLDLFIQNSKNNILTDYAIFYKSLMLYLKNDFKMASYTLKSISRESVMAELSNKLKKILTIKQK
jgi:hypothetical protein